MGVAALVAACLKWGFGSVIGGVPVPERLHDDGYRTMEFGSSNFPSLERGDWSSGKVCVCGGAEHTHVHTRSHHSGPRPRPPPHNSGMSPRQVLASSYVLLFS